jgi:hypothetical protein
MTTFTNGVWVQAGDQVSSGSLAYYKARNITEVYLQVGSWQDDNSILYINSGSSLTTAISDAHAQSIKIFAWITSQTTEGGEINIWSSGVRATAIASLTGLLTSFNFDGIADDVEDYNGSYVNYSDFALWCDEATAGVHAAHPTKKYYATCASGYQPSNMADFGAVTVDKWLPMMYGGYPDSESGPNGYKTYIDYVLVHTSCPVSFIMRAETPIYFPFKDPDYLSFGDVLDWYDEQIAISPTTYLDGFNIFWQPNMDSTQWASWSSWATKSSGGGAGTGSYLISATSDVYSTISPSGNTYVTSGSNQLFTYTGSTNHTVTQVAVDTVPVTISGSYTFTNVTSNHSIVVTTTADYGAVNATNAMWFDTVDELLDLGSNISPALQSLKDYEFSEMFVAIATIEDGSGTTVVKEGGQPDSDFEDFCDYVHAFGMKAYGSLYCNLDENGDWRPDISSPANITSIVNQFITLIDLGFDGGIIDFEAWTGTDADAVDFLNAFGSACHSGSKLGAVYFGIDGNMIGSTWNPYSHEAEILPYLSNIDFLNIRLSPVNPYADSMYSRLLTYAINPWMPQIRGAATNSEGETPQSSINFYNAEFAENGTEDFRGSATYEYSYLTPTELSTLQNWDYWSTGSYPVYTGSYVTDTTGSTTTFLDAQDPYLQGCNIKASDSGSLISLGINIRNAYGHIMMGIYSSITGSTFNGLLEQSLSTTATAGWNDLSIPNNIPITSGSIYYVTFQCDTGSLEIYASTFPQDYWAYNDYGTFPDPSNSITVDNSITPNLRMTYVKYTTGSSTGSVMYPAYVSTPQLSSYSIVTGSSITSSVAVSGSYGVPTGSVHLMVSSDDGDTWTQVGTTKTLTGSLTGSAAFDSYTPSNYGNYLFVVDYNGDSVYNWSSGPDTTLSVYQTGTGSKTLTIRTRLL